MKHSSLIWGLILIGLGVAFLLNQFIPGLFSWFEWPWILIALGGIFAVTSLVRRVGGMMIPGLILLGLGGIFLYQTTTDNWESWAYVWTLMPALAGLGMFIGGSYDPDMRPARVGGLFLFVGGLAAFAVFGAVFTGLFGLNAGILRFWPVLLILLGLAVLVGSMRKGKKRDE